MSDIRVRLLGGVLNGQVLWMEESLDSLDVHVSGGLGKHKTLRYKRDGATAVFVTEIGAVPENGIQA